MPDTLSVILVNYRTSSLIEKCITSIKSQGIPFELVVVDNSVSEQETVALQQLRGKFRFKLLVCPRNSGYGHACNLALKYTRSRYLLCINPDVLALEGSLRNMLYCMKQNDAWMVGPKFYWDIGKIFHLPPSTQTNWIIDSMQIWSNKFRTVARLWKRQWLTRELHFLSIKKPVRQQVISGACFLIDKTRIKSIGGLFDSRFFLYFEDTDLCRRIRQNEGLIMLDPAAEMVHFYAQSPQENSTKIAAMEESHKTYQQSYSRWQTRFLEIQHLLSTRIRNISTTMEKYIDLDEISYAPLFQWNHHTPCWFRVGINPMMIPTAIAATEKQCFHFPAEVWQRLAPGRYFAEALSHDTLSTVANWTFIKKNGHE